MIRVAIIEDDADDAAELKKNVEDVIGELGKTCEIAMFGNPLRFLDTYKPDYDLVFMEIEMPAMNGLETAKILRQKDKSVVLIFVTNVARFAVDGYTVDAADFLVKPVEAGNLRVKLTRALNKIDNGKAERIIIRCKTGACVEIVSRIKYVEVMDHKLLFHTVDKTIAATGSLNKVEAQLKKYGFSKCNSCYLVNLDYVTEINDKTVHVGGDRLVMSRGRTKPFMKDLANRLGGV